MAQVMQSSGKIAYCLGSRSECLKKRMIDYALTGSVFCLAASVGSVALSCFNEEEHCSRIGFNSAFIALSPLVGAVACPLVGLLNEAVDAMESYLGSNPLVQRTIRYIF